MKTSLFCIRFLLTAVFALCLAAPARAASAVPTNDPAPDLLKTINSVIDMVVGQTPATIDSRVPEIRTKMDESFATEAIVHRAFGRNWSKLTPAQQTEAVDLLGRLVIRTYATALSTGGRPVVTIVSSKLISSDRREVTTTASQNGKTANVVYRFAPFDGKWKVYDVLAENVSVVGNYRQQFDAHFQTKSAEDLLKTLREKLTQPVPAEKAK